MALFSGYKENYYEVEGIRLHYVDEGSGKPILMVHGQPTWSYLSRKMMGFGLSDKPSNESLYSLRRHVRHITSLVEHLGLRELTTVGQDWGGPISLRYAIENRNNMRALVILNTLVRTFQTKPLIARVFFLIFANGVFSSFLTRRLDLFRRLALSRGFYRPIDPKAMEQYTLPHPNAKTRAGIAAFPKMLPTSPKHPNSSYVDEIEETLKTWDVKVLVMFSDKDAFFKVEEGKRIAEMVPNGQFAVVANAGHYLQEDAGEEIAGRMITFLGDSARPWSK